MTDSNPDNAEVNQIAQNQPAWVKLFEQHHILERIERDGQFRISAKDIKKVREPRLMVKFDQSGSRPAIFRENKLSILPVSRSEYVIGPFKTHERVPYDLDSEPELMVPPESLELQTIDTSSLYSEAAAINCAHVVGIIDDLVGEETYLTVSGRMGTGSFELQIDSAKKGEPYTIQVNNSQCEIDGGFESASRFVILEAKNITMQDFLVRQLYYPYRLWRQRISKPVVPVLMTYSNDTFDCFVYDFVDPNDYNSLQLVCNKRYTVVPQDVTRADVYAVLSSISAFASETVTFPQADTFNSVVDMLTLVYTNGRLSPEFIRGKFGLYTSRQVNYYTDAGRYLGLLEKRSEKVPGSSTSETWYYLTEDGRRLFQQRPRERYINIIRRILQHEVFNRAFRAWLDTGDVPDKPTIVRYMAEGNINLNGTTPGRRASSVQSWLKWIVNRMVD